MKIVVSAGISISILLLSCGNHAKETITAQPPAISVVIATAAAAVSDGIQASGQVESSQTAAISTRIMGTIVSLPVKVGDRVAQGQVLATVSADDMLAKKAQAEAAIAEAEAHLVTAGKDYNRFNNLYRTESATAKELEQVTLQYNAAKARVEAARQMRNEVNAMMGYSTLRAPFAGIITQKMAEAGSMANPGMPLLMIENSGQKQVTATVAEADISHIKIGETASVLIKSTGKSFEGKITQLNPSSQFTGAQYVIKIAIPVTEQANVLPGMYVNVRTKAAGVLQPESTPTVMVPVSCIINKDELTGIYTISADNKALLRWVRLGKQQGDQVEVLSGLSKEEKYIVRAEGKLSDGQPVTVSANN